MRIIGSLLILIMFFAGGLYWGLMYEPSEKESPVAEEQPIENKIEAELIELNEPLDNESHEFAKLEHVDDHPVQKVATTFEKITAYFFDKVISFLFFLAQLLF